MADFAGQRKTMVDNQIRTVDVTDPAVLDAFGTVPREIFVPAALRDFAYVDRPIAVAAGRFVPQPAPFAKLVQLAAPRAEERVLLIGGTTGWPAAILAALCGHLTMVESDPTLAATATANLAGTAVSIVVGPLAAGAPAAGPFDLILVDGAVDAIPDALVDQLVVGGRIVAVVGDGLSAQATLIAKSAIGASQRTAFNLPALPLAEFRRPKVFAL
ncbi:protein-L-isoaspartate O-methyltransferase [Siculibacillus lacustris]|uniref:Protein-L-isoaspartate O-methyltransferase n=1 Tax=Siculibacillus lacustris TaxID=1549641 RepID=A0A4Q9VQA6_9HYPH|nr:protein-L-isoaspartate O-methyltransferase [Siculibacillus lacustris]TBW37979.1 protein-L-isoaspartate O-methyltransferase [Siculibacillus lacustris]